MSEINNTHENTACKDCGRDVPDHWRIRAGHDWFCGQCFEGNAMVAGEHRAMQAFARLFTNLAADPGAFRMFEMGIYDNHGESTRIDHEFHRLGGDDPWTADR